MADPTGPDPTSLELVAEIQQLVKQLAHQQFEQQAWIIAIAAYLREQPACDVERLAALLEEKRAQLRLAPRPDTTLDAALQALLRGFEGPPQ
jgi:hypothetical protein